MGLYACASNKVHPTGSQYYFLGHNRDIEYYSDSAYCIDAQGGNLQLSSCHHQQGSQYFRYDLSTQQLKSTSAEQRCIEADATGSNMSIKPCNSENGRQKWRWGRVNEANLKNWTNVGAKIL
jgi:polypeptide N-acetylgalactosaminyltransferase